MNINGTLELKWWPRADDHSWRPEVTFINVKRKPPTVPGVWLSGFDRNCSGVFTVIWGRFFLSASWGNCYLWATPKGLKPNYDVVSRQAQLYHGKDVHEEMQALLRQEMDLHMKQHNLQWYGTTEAPCEQ